MRQFPPPSPPRHPARWHACRHPLVHGLSITLALGAWLCWALTYGWRWAVMPSHAFSPGLNVLMLCVFGVGWLLLVIPCITTTIVVLGLGDCTGQEHLRTTTPREDLDVRTHRATALQRRRTTERLIFSPDDAAKRFGIRGTIIIERDTEE